MHMCQRLGVTDAYVAVLWQVGPIDRITQPLTLNNIWHVGSSQSNPTTQTGGSYLIYPYTLTCRSHTVTCHVGQATDLPCGSHQLAPTPAMRVPPISTNACHVGPSPPHQPAMCVQPHPTPTKLPCGSNPTPPPPTCHVGPTPTNTSSWHVGPDHLPALWVWCG
jgi:hypothetical protein